MTLDRFWEIIEKVHHPAPTDMDAKCALLEEELRKLSESELISFNNHFDDCRDRAYSHQLWAAAYVIGKGCSDDKFMDFRATLISMGRAIFENALTSPESLADTALDEDNAFYESYHYPVIKVLQEKAGRLVPRAKPHPAKPSGTPWTDDETPAKWYPKLAHKHHYGYATPKPWWKFW